MQGSCNLPGEVSDQSICQSKLDVVLDSQLLFSSRNANMTQLYSFLLYNIKVKVKRIWNDYSSLC